MKNSWIHVSRGLVPRQARVAISEGIREEHVSRKGFAGQTAMLYHGHAPARALRVEGSLRPAMFQTADAHTDDINDPRAMPTAILRNDDVTMYVSRRTAAMPFAFRNVDADMLYFVHAGEGVFATEFGPLRYRAGDFVHMPKGVTFRQLPDSAEGFFVIYESVAPISFTEHAQVGRHAPFDPTVVEIPEITKYDWPAQEEWEVRCKHGDELTSIFYASNPLQLVGWKGDLFPHRLNIDDIRPITSERLHLAPSSWSVYEAEGFMLVAFLPMSIVADPDAEEMPDYHRNVDTDEAIFIHKQGRYSPGMLAHLPQGITHGPDEDARHAFDAVRKAGMQRTLVGISLDTFKRLRRTSEAHALLGP